MQAAKKLMFLNVTYNIGKKVNKILKSPTASRKAFRVPKTGKFNDLDKLMYLSLIHI